MFLRNSALSAAILILSSVVANATPVSPITLSDGIEVVDTVNSLSSGLANDQNWFTFHATAGSVLDIDINRRAAPADLFARLYFGDVAGVDFGTQITPSPSLGLMLLQTRDDSENDAFGGPWGDPRFGLTAAHTGIYSFYVTALSGYSWSGAVGSSFDVTVTGASATSSADLPAVPIPAGLPLLLSALGLMAFVSVRRTHKAA